MGVHRDLLRHPAIAGRRQHAVADAQALDAVAHGLDHAGNLGARRERPLRLDLVAVLDDQDVGVVHTHGVDREQDLPSRWRRVWKVLEYQCLWSAGFMADDCFQGPVSSGA